MEGGILQNIGVVYSELWQYYRAIEYCEQALAIHREVKNRSGEGGTLYNLGSAYEALSQYDRAVEYFVQALDICREIKYRRLEGRILHNIGMVYNDIRQYHRAIEYYEQALLIHREVKDRACEKITLSNIGSVMISLGQYERAVEYYKKVLAICRDLKDIYSTGGLLNDLGTVYEELGQYKRAVVYYKKALAIHREVKNRYWERITLNNLGYLYGLFGQNEQALEYHKKALTISREIKDRSGEGRTLSDLGIVYQALGQYERAVEYYAKAIAIYREVKNYSEDGNTFACLMDVWEKWDRYLLAIFYGKQSVNVVGETRKNIRKFEQNIQISYLEKNKLKYRVLINLLITKGRLSEAQQVLDMLKEEEFFEFILKDRSAAEVLDTTVDFTEFERQWLEKYNAVMKNLAKVSREHHILKFKKNKSDSEKRRIKELQLRLKKAQKAYEEFLTQLKEAFDQYEKDKVAMKEDIKNLEEQASALRDTLKYLDEKEGGRHAALHYLVYKGRISVILTTPSGRLVKQTEFDENKFNEMVMAYRNFMMDAGRGIHRIKPPNDRETIIIKKIKSYEKDFYDIIFKAVDEELKKYRATNLVVSLDGVLRYLPLGALWNGENYLLQRYRIAIVTPSSLKKIKEEPVKRKKILGLGASQGSQEFPPLDNVPAEIRSIVRDEENGYYGLIKGKAFIDDDFTRDTMIDQLKSDNFPLVHIASHFKFSPGDETKNHLLLGDGTTMKLSEIRRMGKLFNNVKLLVLSACQTGVGGNGEEIDGFGELAHQSGAKSVVASLWPVADESTKDLMLTFYGILKEGKVTGKIEALRQAQLELAGLEDLLAKDKNKIDQSSRQKTEYSHPYYWGPFIMMGNWR
ncbi:MAG: CHAT domain-containing protein [Candidatus Aminicenantes bacterium]|nr:CHAT domain-containing protein [Candidatus Aminicenantes bacterium]